MGFFKKLKQKLESTSCSDIEIVRMLAENLREQKFEDLNKRSRDQFLMLLNKILQQDEVKSLSCKTTSSQQNYIKYIRDLMSSYNYKMDISILQMQEMENLLKKYTNDYKKLSNKVEELSEDNVMLLNDFLAIEQENKSLKNDLQNRQVVPSKRKYVSTKSQGAYL